MISIGFSRFSEVRFPSLIGEWLCGDGDGRDGDFFFFQFSIIICCTIFLRKNYFANGNMKEEKACYTRVFCVSYLISFVFIRVCR